MQQYHDDEWGVPTHDDIHLFEILSLEIAQAGLSWNTILKMRPCYREAFDNFDFRSIADYDSVKVEFLLANKGIVRNKLKILSIIHNAKQALHIQNKLCSLDSFFWQFSPDKKRDDSLEDDFFFPKKMSLELRRLGWKFIGPTICNSFMQAAGMVNHHSKGCFLAQGN